MRKSFLVAELFVEVMDRRIERQREIAEEAVSQFVAVTKNAGAAGALVNVENCPSDAHGKHILVVALFGTGDGAISDTLAMGPHLQSIVTKGLGATIALKSFGMAAEFTLRYSTAEELAKLTEAASAIKQEQNKREQVLVDLISKTVQPSAAGIN